LSELDTIAAPSDLAEQIKTACLVATLMEPRPRPARMWVPASLASATALIAAVQPKIVQVAPEVVVRPSTVVARGMDAAGPRMILAAYHPADASRRSVPSFVQPASAVVSVTPQPARMRMVRGVLVSGIGGPDPASIAAAARRHADATGSSGDDGSDGDVNGEVATQVAAGVVAGAVIEKYLATTIASRGAAMAATDAAYDASFAADDAASDDDDATSSG
jgi:hypothetical protein